MVRMALMRSRATSGSAPSLTVSAQVVCSTQRCRTPSWAPAPRTRSRTASVMSSSSSRSVLRTVMRRSGTVIEAVQPGQLELYGDVTDAEGAHPRVDLAEHERVLLGVPHDGVAAHGAKAAGQGPDVQVVHFVDPGDFADGAADGRQIDVARHGLEQDIDGFAHELP